MKPLARMAPFQDSAEALAAYALTRPVATAAEVRLEEAPSDRHFTRATVTIDGQAVAGYSKSTSRDNAATQIIMATLANLLGAPSAPCLLVTGCAPHRAMREGRDHAPELRLFSAIPFATYGGGCDRKGVGGGLAMQPRSLGAASQFRAWINDPDSVRPNTILCLASGAICLIDHEFAAPQGSMRIEPANAALISSALHAMDTSEESRELLNAMTDMAGRSHEGSLSQLAPTLNVLQTAGAAINSHMISGLRRRQALFANGPVGVKAYTRPPAVPFAHYAPPQHA